MAKKVKLEVEFTLPEGVTHMGDILFRLGIRIKQLAETNWQYAPEGAESFKGDLMIRNLQVQDV